MPVPPWRGVAEVLVQDIFVASIVTYSVFSILEAFMPGFITDFIDLTIVILFVIVSGLLLLVWSGQQVTEASSDKDVQRLLWRALFVGGCAAFLIALKMMPYGKPGIAVAGISGLSAAILFVLLVSFRSDRQHADGRPHERKL